MFSVLSGTVYISFAFRILIRWPFFIVTLALRIIYNVIAFVFSAVWSLYNFLRGFLGFTTNKALDKSIYALGRRLNTFYTEDIKNNPFFDSGIWYALRLLFKWFVYNPVKWVVGFGRVIARSVLPLAFLICVIASTSLMLYGFLAAEGNLDTSIRIFSNVTMGFIQFVNALIKGYNTFIVLFNPFLPYIYLFTTYLYRLAILIADAAFTSVGLKAPFTYGARNLATFGPQDKAVADLQVAHDNLVLVAQWFYVFVSGYLDALLAIAEVFITIFFQTVRFIAAIFTQGIKNLGCCGQNWQCCAREVIGYVLTAVLIFRGPFTVIRLVGGTFKKSAAAKALSFLTNNPIIAGLLKLISTGLGFLATFIACSSGDLDGVDCECSLKEGGFFRNGQVCEPPIYACIQDTETGIWSQTIQRDRSREPIVQISNIDKELACPYVYRNIEGSSRTLEEFSTTVPFKVPRCSSYCYPNKYNTHMPGWEIERCMDEETPVLVGECFVGDTERLTRRLDHNNNPYKIRNSLKEFHKQYKFKRHVKPLSVKERRKRLHEKMEARMEQKTLNEEIVKEDFVELLAKLKEESNHKFPSSYDPESPTFLESLMYEQFTILGLMMDNENAKVQAEKMRKEMQEARKLEEQLNDFEGETFFEAAPTEETSFSPYMRALVHIASSVSWKVENGHEITIDHFTLYHRKLVDVHKKVMFDTFGYHSKVGSLLGYEKDFGEMVSTHFRALHAIDKQTRGRKLTDNTYTQNRFSEEVDWGVFGPACEWYCGDGTCVELKDITKCPEPQGWLEYLVIKPAELVVTYEETFNAQYLVDNAFGCWQAWMQNPSINPMSTDKGGTDISNYNLVFYTDPATYTEEQQRRYDNIRWCFPILVPRLPAIELITWTPYETLTRWCGNTEANNCQCSFFSPPGAIVDYDTMILTFLPESTWARIYDSYVYLAMGVSYVADGWFNNIWKSFLSLFNLQQFPQLDWLYNFFDFGYNTNNAANEEIALCSIIHLPSLYYFVILILLPTIILAYHGLFNLLQEIGYDVAEVILFIPFNFFTFVDTLQAHRLGISLRTLRERREVQAMENYDFLSRLVADQVSAMRSKVIDGTEKVSDVESSFPVTTNRSNFFSRLKNSLNSKVKTR